MSGKVATKAKRKAKPKTKTNGTSAPDEAKLEPELVEGEAAVTEGREALDQYPDRRDEDGKVIAPLLSELLPDLGNEKRVSFLKSEGTPLIVSDQQLAVVWLVLNGDKKLADCSDPRVRMLANDVDKMRGHGAREIAALPAALIRGPGNAPIILVSRTLQNLQQDRLGDWVSVGKYTPQSETRLDVDPAPVKHVITPEQLCRLDQLEHSLSDDEAQRRYSPVSPNTFAQTTVQRTDVRMVLYRPMNTSSGILFIEHHNLIWKLSGLPVRAAPLRRADPDGSIRAERENARRVEQFNKQFI